MESKSLLFGIIGFIAGGLIVSIAATTFEKPKDTMPSSMVSSLEGKAGDDFDSTFISGMIAHHQEAIDMARLADGQAKHQEIKDLSKAIIGAQQKEIDAMKQWRIEWGYDSASSESMHH
ncbi:MAG TPA: DUF305 domain-containing protein [Candidatus Saccharimonadales bacterium]|nr:DUF305 domain-containing protein [Candidatus Saccharimonadales bacterium]